MAQATTYGLTHLAIAVSNIKRTKSFYQHIFGMEVMYEEERFLQLTTPGSNDILVFEVKEDAEIGHTGGIAHFGFRLKDPKDIDEVTSKVISAGAEITESGEFVPGSPYVYFKDPDGYIIEIWYEMLPFHALS
ncbi:MAG TPA: VOC family protein [Candidatus Kapabacteria bacterium]